MEELDERAFLFGIQVRPNGDGLGGIAYHKFHQANRDIFAWQPYDMTGVPKELAEHSLNVNPNAKPIKQSLRRFGDEKRKAIAKELARLELAGFIEEDTTDLRMCVD